MPVFELFEPIDKIRETSNVGQYTVYTCAYIASPFSKDFPGEKWHFISIYRENTLMFMER